MWGCRYDEILEDETDLPVAGTYRQRGYISKNQYVYEDDGKRAHIYFLNESKWAEFLENEKLLDSFVSEIHRKFMHFSIYDFLNAYRRNNCQPESLKGLMKKLVDSGVLLKPETADVPYSKNPRNALNDIHTFIKDSEGRMYIPGSSLKGAFRTAIIATMIRKIEEGMKNAGMKYLISLRETII